ncbi:hypothetical protein QM298_22895 [Pseudomonas mendocina]|nr:hypothetical protein [Pseudomonas mendocina]MDV5863674.1 hypothetical protein [Pseudomonas mendocina]
MKTKSLIIIAFAFGITACGDSNEKAIGLYKYNVALTGTEKIAEIKKDGDAYLFVEDAIRKSNAIALTKTSDGLSYNNMPLKLSEDGNTLYFGPINGARVDANYLSERLASIESNKKACAELQSEVEQNDKSMNKEQWNEYIKSINGKKPNGCNIIGAGMRW